jgi:hypothetical protein
LSAYKNSFFLKLFLAIAGSDKRFQKLIFSNDASNEDPQTFNKFGKSPEP